MERKRISNFNNLLPLPFNHFNYLRYDFLMINKKVLERLPSGKFVKFSTEEDWNEVLHQVIIWKFKKNNRIKLAAFDSRTGEYVTDVA
jgi:hypothetical protein